MTIEALAAEAATHWQGRVIRLIRNRENAVFEMVTPAGRAALRLHRMGYQDATAIRSELWWCTELAAAGLAVPQPLATVEGRLLVTLGNGRTASAIAWIEGEALGEAGRAFDLPVPVLTARHRALGRLVAEVHQATDRLQLPADFVRPFWDIPGLVGEQPFWGRFWEHPAANADQQAALRRARNFLHERLQDHAAAGGDLGPIHADVLRENVLVNDSSLSLIDFDDSGIGFRLYDLGTVLSQNLYEPHFARIRSALIDGYAEVRPAEADMVDVFTLARTCASVGWTMPRLEVSDPVCARHIARAVMCADRVMSRPG